MLQRAHLKALMPTPLRRGLERVRRALNGPGIEYDVLGDYIFEADPETRPRFSMVMPNISRSQAFGGVMTGIDLLTGLRAALEGVDFRIVSETAPATGDDLIAATPALEGIEVLHLSAVGRRLPMRAREMVLAYNWWTSLNLEPVIAAQAQAFDRPPRPKVHLIQDYEPHFYGFSTPHLLARSAMGDSWPLWGVFNSSELFTYWQRQGHSAEKTFVFEPMMNMGLRSHLSGLDAKDKTRTLLVYGRADVPRNAFYLVETGLKAWGARHGAKRSDWRIVSAGTPHDDIPLGGGHVLRSLGKLSLEGYADLLRETAAGLSLMVSPHPSYPPLEMAHFGVRVMTNGYADKALAGRHDNITELKSLRPEAIGDAIEATMAEFEADPGGGLRAQSHMPDYLTATRIGCLDPLARALGAALNE